MINSRSKTSFFVKVLSASITRSKTEVIIRALKLNDPDSCQILKMIPSQADAQDVAPRVFQPQRGGSIPLSLLLGAEIHENQHLGVYMDSLCPRIQQQIAGGID